MKTSRERINPSVGALWASAFILAGLVVMQAGRLGAGAQAEASVVNFAGVTALSASTGNNSTVILVMDDRTDTVLVYGVENRNRVELYQNLKLSELFAQSQTQRQGGGRSR
jgi:hypothetical protein